MTPPGQESTTPPSDQGAATSLSLFDRQWLLQQYGPAEQPSTPLTDTQITLTFKQDGTVQGSSGCNSYFANYTIDGQRLTIEQPGRTEMACAEPVMQQENRFLETLISAESLTVADDKLTIVYQGGELHFTALPPAAVTPLTDTLWQLTTFVQGDTAQSTVGGTSVTVTFKEDGTVGGTTGCNEYGGKYALDGQQITITELVQTMRACIDQAAMDQEARYVAALRAVTAWSIEGSTLMLSYDGGALHFTVQSSQATR